MSNSKMRIIVLNDNGELMKLITDRLAQKGFETTGEFLEKLWNDAAKSSALLKFFHPHIAVVDVLFPYAGYWRYATRLLIKQNPKMAFIFTATDTEGIKKITGTLHTPFRLIKKPYYLNELVGKVESIQKEWKNRPLRLFHSFMQQGGVQI